MPYILWQDTFLTNVPLIDNQHRTLVAMINRLESGVSSGNDDQEIGKVITELVQYTKKHFGDEESYMRRINYAGLDRHKKLHQDLVKQIVVILQRLKSGEDLNTYELMSLLKDWLINHILKEDVQIGRAVVVRARHSS